MISEGPSLIEALPGELQSALNSALYPGEELIIAVRGNAKEAFAATPERMLLLKEPIISGSGPVQIREVPLKTASRFRAEPRPVGGRLTWETTAPGAPTFTEYVTYDASKYSLVAQRLQQMSGSTPSPAASGAGSSAAAGATRPCPKCGTGVPSEGAWCPSCGLQVSDPCWQCGQPLAEGANFCSRCGTPNSEPAVVSCPQCRTLVARGYGYCTACGTQARPVCEECDRPMRKDWKHCPECGGGPVWEAAGIRTEVAHLRGDEPEDPSAWLRSAPRSGDGDGEELNAAGIRAYETENYQEAVRLFREAIRADGSNASYFTNLGVAYGEMGDDLQAFTAYRKAVELNPNEMQAYLNMGYLYNERERYPEAREMWEKVVRLAPSSDEASEARDNLRSMGDV